jgi:penicillin-binding protein 1A
LVAIKLEKIADKKGILETYLNAIYFGHNIFGVKTAALEYFGKDLSELDLNESAFLAGLIQAPNKYCISQNKELGNKRKNKVLELMHKNNFISRSDLIRNKANSLKPAYSRERSTFNYLSTNAYYLDYVKKYLLKNHADLFPFRQMIIRTTFDENCQTAIDKTIEEVALNNKGQKLSCLIMDKNDGGVKALRSGIDYQSECFNIAVNGYLQPGSTIKPFILAQALRQGISLESKFESKKLSVELLGGKRWEVRNFNDIYRGSISMAEALIYSDNSVFAQLISYLDLDALKTFLKEVGIDIGMPTLALATGAICPGISPLQVVAAYTVFSNKGYYLPATPINGIETPSGEKLFRSNLSTRYVLDSTIADEIDDVLRRVPTEGTGNFKNLVIPNLRAKTGTTDTESWYVSYDDKYHLLTWVGEKRSFECDEGEKGYVSISQSIGKRTENEYSEKTEKAITAKQIAQRIWEYLRTKNKLGDFSVVAKGIEKLNSTKVTELEGYFMPWGEHGKIYH